MLPGTMRGTSRQRQLRTRSSGLINSNHLSAAKKSYVEEVFRLFMSRGIS